MVLLVIDTQKLITNDKLYAFDTFVSTVQTLIKAAREKGIEVIYVRHDDGPTHELTKGTEGYEVYGGFKPNADEKIFDKTVNSAFKESGLLTYLKQKGEKQVIITGLETDFCIDATVKCAFEHSFEVIIPAYGNTTVDNQFMRADESYRYYNEWMWKERYARCLSLEETLALMQ